MEQAAKSAEEFVGVVGGYGEDTAWVAALYRGLGVVPAQLPAIRSLPLTWEIWTMS